MFLFQHLDCLVWMIAFLFLVDLMCSSAVAAHPPQGVVFSDILFQLTDCSMFMTVVGENLIKLTVSEIPNTVHMAPTAM